MRVRNKGAIPSMPVKEAVLQLLEHPVAEEKLSVPNGEDSRVMKLKNLFDNIENAETSLLVSLEPQL